MGINVDGQFPTVFVDHMNIEGTTTLPLRDLAEAPRRIFKEPRNLGSRIGKNDTFHD